MSVDRSILQMDVERFKNEFGTPGRVFIATAPGRVNLIGEHTDYHEGFVFPMAIDRYVRAVGALRSDPTVRVVSNTFKENYSFSLLSPMSERQGWARRAEGIIRTVLELSPRPVGMNIYMDADLPVGGGLSSSAASMAALGLLAARLNGFALNKLTFAKSLQRSEWIYAGLQCGIMDQLAVLMGEKDKALFLDCQSLEMSPVALPNEWRVVILDSGVKHDLASSAYNDRVAECAAVVRALNASNPRLNLESLREVQPQQLEGLSGAVPEISLKRCRHVFAENQRTVAMSEALKQRDADTVGRLMLQSHESLRDHYEVSCKEIDLLVDLAMNAPGVVGARITGGGFGGSTVNLVWKDEVSVFLKQILPAYQEKTGIEIDPIIAKASEGASLMEWKA